MKINWCLSFDDDNDDHHDHVIADADAFKQRMLTRIYNMLVKCF